jgi:hypothetical protein
VSVLRFSTAGWDGEWLRAGWALLPRSGSGVGRVEHVQALADTDCSEELVIHQVSNLENQLQMLRVQEGVARVVSAARSLFPFVPTPACLSSILWDYSVAPPLPRRCRARRFALRKDLGLL